MADLVMGNLSSRCLEFTPEFLLGTLTQPPKRQLSHRRIWSVPRATYLLLWILNIFQKIPKNAKLPCNHFPSRHAIRVCLQKLPLMPSTLARGSRAFPLRQLSVE